jgi:hypothetical protein
MENIDKFNGHAAKILAKLYSSFPETTSLDCREFVHGMVPPENVLLNELQEATKDPQIRFCAAALQWLHETEYFKGDPAAHYVRIHRAVLTPKGLEAMAATPTVLVSALASGRRSEVRSPSDQCLVGNPKPPPLS